MTDGLSGVRFASAMADPAAFPHLLCRYARPLICYPGQEAVFEAKRGNCELALRACDRACIAAGETFSFWRWVGRPTSNAGYRQAAALKDGNLTLDIGGAICLVSTVLYNVALLGCQRIRERSCHSVDSYGDARYFELGRDAAVEYAYRDLRFRNDLASAVLLRGRIVDGSVIAELWTAEPVDLVVSLESSTPEYHRGHLRVRTLRKATIGGVQSTEDLGWSVHRLPDADGNSSAD